MKDEDVAGRENPQSAIGNRQSVIRNHGVTRHFDEGAATTLCGQGGRRSVFDVTGMTLSA